MNRKFFALWTEFMRDLTSGLFVLTQLKLNASVKLSGDQTVGYNHHHSWDEEQSEQKQNVPEREKKWNKNEMLTTHRDRTQL